MWLKTSSFRIRPVYRSLDARSTSRTRHFGDDARYPTHAGARLDFVQTTIEYRHSSPMPMDTGLPPGTLVMLILRVLQAETLHGYAIAQRIHQLSREELTVEEGSLYPALQKLLLKGWVKASPAISETGRAVREYRLTPAGRRQLELERTNYRRLTTAIGAVLDTA